MNYKIWNKLLKKIIKKLQELQNICKIDLDLNNKWKKIKKFHKRKVKMKMNYKIWNKLLKKIIKKLQELQY